MDIYLFHYLLIYVYYRYVYIYIDLLTHGVGEDAEEDVEGVELVVARVHDGERQY